MYYALEDIAGTVRAALAATGAFNDVRVAEISNAGQLLEIVDALNVLPAAVVAVPSADYGTFRRDIELMVVVADDYKVAGEERANGIWRLVEGVAEIFLPRLAQGGTPRTPEFCGIQFAPSSVRPVAGGERIALYMVTVKGTEIYKYDPAEG